MYTTGIKATPRAPLFMKLVMTVAIRPMTIKKKIGDPLLKIGVSSDMSIGVMPLSAEVIKPDRGWMTASSNMMPHATPVDHFLERQ